MQEWRIEHLKKCYPKDTRIRLLHMDDPYNPVEPGTTGTVEMVDDAGQIHVQWDNGRTLAICPEVDLFEKVMEG